MDENSVFAVLRLDHECGDVLFNCPNCFIGIKVSNNFDACW